MAATTHLLSFQNLGESKLNAMKESKDFRAGTRMLRWEKEKLTMELQDLESTWSMMQQIKVIFEWSTLRHSVRYRIQMGPCPLPFTVVQGEPADAAVQKGRQDCRDRGLQPTG